MVPEKLSTTLVGIAGEYLVAGELSRRGYNAAATLRNTKGVDIFASSDESGRLIGIQVKTSRSPKVKFWWLNEKADHECRDDLFYVFVNLNFLDLDHLGPPTYHVVPSETVARFSSHWLHWRSAKNESIRAFQDSGSAMQFWPSASDEGVFRDRWDLLGLNGESMPVADLAISCGKCAGGVRRTAA